MLATKNYPQGQTNIYLQKFHGSILFIATPTQPQAK